MKLKFKFTALTLATVMGVGMLVGCNKEKPAPTPAPKYLVNVPTSADFRIDGIVEDRQYVEGAAVSFSVEVLNEDKELTAAGYQVGAQRTALEPVAGIYTFSMPAQNVSLYASLRDVERYALSHTGTLRVDGDPVTFSLVLGTDPVTDWSLETYSGGEHVTINGHNATGVSQGQVTFAAVVGGQQVAQEEVTVERAAIYTIREAIDDAWANVDNFSDNTKSTQSTEKYKIRAKVVFMGSVYNSKVEMLVDDGTGILDYQVSSSSAITKFAVGDVIEFEEKVQNYYGLMETFSSSVNYITKLTDVTINTTPFTDVTSASQYDTVYNNNIANDGEHKVVPMNVQVQAKKHTEGTQQKDRYEVVGATKGFLATTKSVVSLDWTEGVNYNFHGYLLNWNSSDTAQYCNFVVLEQSRLQANSVTIDQGEEATVNINNDLQLTYTTDPAGAGVEVSWVSSQPSVATVSTAGVVHAEAAGDTVVTLTVDGHTDSITIHVPAELKPATSCIFSQTGADAIIGTPLDLKPLVVVTPADTTDAATWTSGDEETATVADGVVTPLKAGQVQITVTYNASAHDSIIITITAEHGTTIDDPLTVQEAYDIGAALAGVSNQSVYSEKTYYTKGYLTVAPTVSNSTAKADFAMEGKLGLFNTKCGTFTSSDLEKGAEIIVHGQICNYSNKYKIQFGNQAEIVSATSTEAKFVEITGATSVEVGSTTTLTATVFPASLNYSATFSSSDTSVATVDSSTGVVSGEAAGKATITATYQTLSAELNITVVAPLSPTATTVTKTTLIGLTGLDKDGNSVTISSSTTNGTQVPTLNIDTVITMSVNPDGNNGKIYGSGTEWRLYQTNNPTITLAAASGYKLVQVKFTYTISNTAVLKFSGENVESGAVVTLTGSSVTFTVGNTGSATNGQVKITGIEVVYDVVS